jgi:hypothetical protein
MLDTARVNFRLMKMIGKDKEKKNRRGISND